MQLTTSQVAIALGVTRRRVSALITDGRLKAVRFGKAYMINEEDVQAVMVRSRGGRPRKVPR